MTNSAILLVLLFSAIPSAAADLPQDYARMDRGVAVRSALSAALDAAWPDHIQAPASLLYDKPPKLTDAQAAVTVVLHEPLPPHPDGVWVGYADGHLEFAPDAAALAACIDQVKILANPTGASTGPTCHVLGDITSLGLYAAGRAVTRVHAYAFDPAHPGRRLMTSDFNAPKFDFHLPPGDWGLAADGSDCDYAYRYIHIAPGRQDISIHLDIPAYAFTAMFGKTAPELQNIKAWKNGGPVTLAALRGKVVLLDFWGYWCPDCIVAMPELMKLHDQFAPRGLVIIGVHDDSVDSIAEMDQNLTAAIAQKWNGRNLPFLIALDGGGETRIAGSTLTARGATTAHYGILKYPTSLLIDRDGKLQDRIDVGTPGAAAKIEKLLGDH